MIKMKSDSHDRDYTCEMQYEIKLGELWDTLTPKQRFSLLAGSEADLVCPHYSWQTFPISLRIEIAKALFNKQNVRRKLPNAVRVTYKHSAKAPKYTDSPLCRHETNGIHTV